MNERIIVLIFVLSACSAVWGFRGILTGERKKTLHNAFLLTVSYTVFVAVLTYFLNK